MVLSLQVACSTIRHRHLPPTTNHNHPVCGVHGGFDLCTIFRSWKRKDVWVCGEAACRTAATAVTTAARYCWGGGSSYTSFRLIEFASHSQAAARPV